MDLLGPAFDRRQVEQSADLWDDTRKYRLAAVRPAVSAPVRPPKVRPPPTPKPPPKPPEPPRAEREAKIRALKAALPRVFCPCGVWLRTMRCMSRGKCHSCHINAERDRLRAIAARPVKGRLGPLGPPGGFNCGMCNAELKFGVGRGRCSPCVIRYGERPIT